MHTNYFDVMPDQRWAFYGPHGEIEEKARFLIHYQLRN